MRALAAGAEFDAIAPLQPPAKFVLDDCRLGDPAFAAQVRAVATWHGVESRALAVRTLLHLPRVAAHNGRIGRRQLEAELRNCAVGLRADQQKVQDLIPTRSFPLADLRFVECAGDGEVVEIFSHLHYLRSARPGSRNFALVDPVDGRPVTLCSVTPLEWPVVGKQLGKQFGIPLERIWDVSRVYSFDVAPSNAISFMLSRVRAALRRPEDSIELLTTAVDPNLGFTGSSYRAANWQHWLSVKPRPYLYVDGLYVSPRQLRLRYGTANLIEVRAQSGSLVQHSRARMVESKIFCCRVRGETESLAPHGARLVRR